MSLLPCYSLEPCQITPFPHQERAIDAVFREFRAGRRRTMVVHPTGTGKSVTLALVGRRLIEHYGRRMLVLAHLDTLVEQLADSLAEVGLHPAIEKAEKHALACAPTPKLFDDGQPERGPICVVGSVQTMAQPKRLQTWPQDYFGLIVVDEAHHFIKGGTYDRVVSHFGNRLILGMTATPDRYDGECLGQVFESVADQYLLEDAIADGRLVKFKSKRCPVDIDLGALNMRGAKDLSDTDLEDAIRPHIEEIALAIRQWNEGRATIAFTPRVYSADALASALRSLGMKAESVSGQTKNCDEVIEQFRRRDLDVLVNCAVLAEGFDAPHASCVGFIRPTKSRALFAQQAGRGLRTCRGKEDCLFLDFRWRTKDHELLVGPTELFDSPKRSQAVLDLAGKLIERGEEDDVLRAVEQAEKLEFERAKLEIKVRERRLKYHPIIYDPFAVMQSLGMPEKRESEASQSRRSTEAQRKTLARFGVAKPEVLSARRASMMLDELITRSRQGLSTHKQISWLVGRFGYDPVVVRAMTKDQASAELGKFFTEKRA